MFSPLYSGAAPAAAESMVRESDEQVKYRAAIELIANIYDGPHDQEVGCSLGEKHPRVVQRRGLPSR
jgi:hypothetical protein